MENPCLFKLPSGGHCGKHSSGPDSNYCPHHEVVIAEAATRMQELGRRSARARAFKAEREKLLAASPLRAVNPKFQAKHQDAG
jgi:hypothetical protein